MSSESPDLTALLESWKIAIIAQGLSPNTIASYTDSVTAYIRWASGAPITRDSVRRWMAYLIGAGAARATLRVRLTSLKYFELWLYQEQECSRTVIQDLRPPRTGSTKTVTGLSDANLHKLIATCSGTRVADRRDEAMLRVMLDGAMRAAEVLGLARGDIDLAARRATITGKGGKTRVVPLSAATVRAVDRYLRAQAKTRHPVTSPLWVGRAGKPLEYPGLYDMVKRRGDQAGIVIHPHSLRHTAASRWLHAGGSELGVMKLAGWSKREMIAIYTDDTAEQRMLDEAARLDLGSL